eukprot:6200107-Pleurochrysis_carterae.AAC.1
MWGCRKHVGSLACASSLIGLSRLWRRRSCPLRARNAVNSAMLWALSSGPWSRPNVKKHLDETLAKADQKRRWKWRSERRAMTDDNQKNVNTR